MARIVSFEIRGLAGRRGVVQHELRTDVLVFWGLNGSGKTSLLKILHSALTNNAASLLRVPFDSAVVEIWDEMTGTFYTRRITKNQIEKRSPQADYYWKNMRHASVGDYGMMTFGGGFAETVIWNTVPSLPEGESGNFHHGYLPISRISEARASSAHRPSAELWDEAVFDRLFVQQVQELWQSYNQRALSEIRDSQERGLARILEHVLVTKHKPAGIKVTDPDAAFSLVKTFFGQQRFGAMVNVNRQTFIKNYRNDKLVQEVVAEVADVQRGVEAALEPQLRIEQLLSDLYTGGKRVTFRGPTVIVESNGHQVPLESLSSGEKQMLQLLLECLSAGPSAVIVDEPELSLHVDWQNRLVYCMRTVNQEAQLLLATHSPEVMANLSDTSIFEL